MHAVGEDSGQLCTAPIIPEAIARERERPHTPPITSKLLSISPIHAYLPEVAAQDRRVLLLHQIAQRPVDYPSFRLVLCNKYNILRVRLRNTNDHVTLNILGFGLNETCASLGYDRPL